MSGASDLSRSKSGTGSFWGSQITFAGLQRDGGSGVGFGFESQQQAGSGDSRLDFYDFTDSQSRVHEFDAVSRVSFDSRAFNSRAFNSRTFDSSTLDPRIPGSRDDLDWDGLGGDNMSEDGLNDDLQDGDHPMSDELALEAGSEPENVDNGEKERASGRASRRSKNSSKTSSENSSKNSSKTSGKKSSKSDPREKTKGNNDKKDKEGVPFASDQLFLPRQNASQAFYSRSYAFLKQYGEFDPFRATYSYDAQQATIYGFLRKVLKLSKKEATFLQEEFGKHYIPFPNFDHWHLWYQGPLKKSRKAFVTLFRHSPHLLLSLPTDCADFEDLLAFTGCVELAVKFRNIEHFEAICESFAECEELFGEKIDTNCLLEKCSFFFVDPERVVQAVKRCCEGRVVRSPDVTLAMQDIIGGQNLNSKSLSKRQELDYFITAGRPFGKNYYADRDARKYHTDRFWHLYPYHRGRGERRDCSQQGWYHNQGWEEVKYGKGYAKRFWVKPTEE